MPIPSSGQLSMSIIRNELAPINGNYQLGSLSRTACKSAPDAMSEFYGYTFGFSVAWMVRAGGAGGGGVGPGCGICQGGGGGGGAGASSGGFMTLYKNVSYGLNVGGGGGGNTNGTGGYG